MAEMYRQFAEIGGLAYESNIQIKMGMGGGGRCRWAACWRRSATSRSQTLVDDVQTGALADDLFAPPAGYKLNTQK